MNLRILPHFIHNSRFLLQATKTLGGGHVALVINCVFSLSERVIQQSELTSTLESENLNSSPNSIT